MAPRDPFDLPLDDEQHDVLANWLCDELNNALGARSASDAEVEYYHQLYEQARTRTGRMPWPDAADLTSHLAAEKVDALNARLMRTVWSEPVYTVEGWGDAAARAPFVEEFHQWKCEEERLQSVLDKLGLISFIEPRGLLEVYEGTDSTRVRKRLNAKIATDEATGGPLYDDTGAPQLAKDDQGKLIEAGEQDPSALVVIDDTDQRTGPQYRILPYRDSVILPGHAREKEEIWGYGKKFRKLVFDLEREAEAGIYDADEVERLTEVGDTEGDAALARAKQAVAPQEKATAEKELWELLVRVDLKRFLAWKGVPLSGKAAKAVDGPRWYVATVQKDQVVLLRFQHDDLERSRFVLVNLYPRTDRCTEGFSLVGHKLITIIEEHTAWRNMGADRGAMLISAPIKRLTGALWDPFEQPMGPKEVIDVRDMREVEPMQLSATGMNEALEHIQMCERNADRVAGANDIASGQVLQQSKTLGEVQMATAAAEVRMDMITRRFQEAMEDLAQIRHAIWKRTLASKPDGIEPPESLMVGLEGRGVSIDQFLPEKKITAALLEGAFRFKPHGSVETADLNRAQALFGQALQTLPALLQLFPSMQMQLQTPEAGRAWMREFCRVFRIPARQAMLGSPAQDLQASLPQMLPPMPPGLPPGMPPGPPMGAGSPPMPPSPPPGLPMPQGVQ